ncbi:MAG: c-type cytochrome [Candidatus Acidiferrales bacterium]
MTVPSRIARALILWAFSMALGIPGIAMGQTTSVDGITGRPEVGKQLYRRFCVGCHGVLGDGKGENAPFVVGPLEDPLPRNFTLGLFKCRSTPSGSIPLDSDLYTTIGRGIYTTYMPPWRALTPGQRVDLIAYVKTFSPRFKDEKPAPPVKITPETPNTADSVKRGEELYQKTLKCFECHGTTGHGDGPSASTLHDNLGNPIKAFDFADGTRFKCGSTDDDLFKIFMTGLDGTPMPSWADYMDPNQAWDLVHYLRSLMVNYHPANAPAKEQKGK